MSRPGLNRTIVNSESKNRSSIELRDDNKHIIILILLRRKDSNLQPSDSKSDATANCATAQCASKASTLDAHERMTSFSFMTNTMISHECNDVKSIMIDMFNIIAISRYIPPCSLSAFL